MSSHVPRIRPAPTRSATTAQEPLVCLGISIECPLDVCEYPDSDKVGIFISGVPKELRNRMFKRGSQVSYLEEE